MKTDIGLGCSFIQQNCLPELKEAVVNRLESTDHQLKLLGNDLPREGPERERAFRDVSTYSKRSFLLTG